MERQLTLSIKSCWTIKNYTPILQRNRSDSTGLAPARQRRAPNFSSNHLKNYTPILQRNGSDSTGLAPARQCRAPNFSSNHLKSSGWSSSIGELVMPLDFSSCIVSGCLVASSKGQIMRTKVLELVHHLK
jgi:hypothetical protein